MAGASALLITRNPQEAAEAFHDTVNPLPETTKALVSGGSVTAGLKVDAYNATVGFAKDRLEQAAVFAGTGGVGFVLDQGLKFVTGRGLLDRIF
jgi:hypothetical protein